MTRSAVISQSLAESLWPGQSPLGRTLEVGESVEPTGVPQQVEVVGVIPDAPFTFRDDRRVVLLSAQQQPSPPGETTLFLRYTGSLDPIAAAIRRSLLEVDARTPIVDMQTVETQVKDNEWPVRTLTRLLMLFAGGSLLIAGIGQYAVVSFNMRRRLREFGLRIALGASSRQVLVSVVREGFLLTGVGVALGFALSLVTGRVLGGALYGVTPTDPLTYGGVFVLLVAVSLLACYLPARHAAAIDPISTLREE